MGTVQIGRFRILARSRLRPAAGRWLTILAGTTTSQKILLLLFLVYPFLLENARMTEAVETHVQFSRVPFPRETRFLEIGLVSVLMVLAFGKNPWPSSRFEKITGLLTAVGFVSVILSPLSTGLLTSIQVLYTYLLFCFPMILLMRTAEISFAELRVYGLLSIMFLLNLLAGVVQVFVIGYRDDHVTGLLRDSHYFATFLLVGLFFLGNSYLRQRRGVTLILFLLTLAVFAAASNQKAYLVAAVSLLVFLFWHYRVGVRHIAFTIIGILLVGALLLFMISLYDQLLVERLVFLARMPIAELGPLSSYADLFSIMRGNPAALLVGVGPGNFADPITFPSVANNPDFPVPPLFYQYVGGNEVVDTMVAVGAFTWRINYFVALTVEIGILGASLFYLLQWKLAKSLMEIGLKSDDPIRQSLSASACLSLIYLILNSLVSVSYTFESIALSWPLYTVIAMVLMENTRRIKRKHR